MIGGCVWTGLHQCCKRFSDVRCARSRLCALDVGDVGEGVVDTHSDEVGG